MAIVKLQPTANPFPERTTPDTIQEPAKSIFTALVPEAKIGSLLKYVEGFPWTTFYYGQILNSNNTLESFDPTTPNLTQPYYKVSGLILQVSSPLTSSYDQNTGITSITGSAITPYKVTPNVGDVFLAQVDTGEDAIFHITSVSRKTHRKDTLYEVNYTLYAYTSANPTFLPTLDQRVNDTYYFNNDSDFFNRDVLIKPSVKEASDRLKLFLKESKDYYFSTFCQKGSGTLVIPGIDNVLYDPLLIDFILKTVEYSYLVNTPLYQHAYASPELDQPSIFNILLTKSSANIARANRTYNFIPANMLPKLARLGMLFHAGMYYVLYPTEPKTDTAISPPNVFEGSLDLSTMKTSKNYTGNNPIVIQTTNNGNVFDKVLLHELFADDYYIVTENFYKYLEDNSFYSSISYIELLIAKFVRKEAIAKEDLVVAVEGYSSFSLLHQMYILPVLWLLANN